ncbi:MAG: T9SS type A sorting domain-containing protein [Saprospiraceae bacterium]
MKNNYPAILFMTILFFLLNNSILSAQGNWENILKDYQFTDLVFAEDHVWISTDSVGIELYCYGGDFYHKIDMLDGLPSNKVRAIEKNEEDEIWIGTDAGIAFSEGKIWTILNEENSNLFSNDVKDIQITKSGKIWIGFDHAIQSFDFQNDTWELFDASNVSFFPDSTFINMEVDADDIVWAAFPNNLIKFSETIEKYTFPPYTWWSSGGTTSTQNTIESEIGYISTDFDGSIRVNNNENHYELYIHNPTKKIGFSFGRDIGGAIYQFNIRDYWWGGSFIIHNAIYYESTDLTTCVNPDTIHVFKNEYMNITPKLGKAPFRFSPSNRLWIIHENGISILNPDNFIACKKKNIPDEEILIFPNPSNGLININIKNESFRSSHLTVYNSGGQLFLEKETFENTCELDLSHLKQGIYFLKFTDGDWSHVEKISIF